MTDELYNRVQSFANNLAAKDPNITPDEIRAIAQALRKAAQQLEQRANKLERQQHRRPH